MEMIGLPKDYVILLLKSACFGVDLPKDEFKQSLDFLKRLEPPASKKASLNKPTGTVEKIVVDRALEQASSVSATPSWSVSRGT
jgi:hypothetical protein